jgi:hypothetical protein
MIRRSLKILAVCLGVPAGRLAKNASTPLKVAGQFCLSVSR